MIDDITKISVKEGTVGIAATALRGLTLDSLALPESLKYLSNSAMARTTATEFTCYDNFEYLGTSAFSEFKYAGLIDIGTPSYVGDYALGYTSFSEIRVGFKNNGNLTLIDGSSMGGAFYQSQAQILMYGPYVKEIVGKACNKMSNLSEVFIASNYLCTVENNAYKTYLSNTGYMTGYTTTVTKIKWIAKSITLEDEVITFMKNAFLGGGFNDDQTSTTKTIDGITYVKYYHA